MNDDDNTTDHDDWTDWAKQESAPERRGFDFYDIAAAITAVLIVVGLIALWGGDVSKNQAALSRLGVPSELYAAQISGVDQAPCLGAETSVCSEVTFLLVAGPDEGAEYRQTFSDSPLNPEWVLGSTAILSRRSPNAIVRGVEPVDCSFDPATTCMMLTLEMTDRADDVTTYEARVGPAFRLGLGDPAIVDRFPGDDSGTALSVIPLDVEQIYQFTGDFQRRGVLWVIAGLFALTVIALGRGRGVAALIGLVLSVSILLLFVLPAILSGRSPVLVAVVGAAAIAFVSLYLAHSYTRMTTVAMLGMMSALVLTAILAAITLEVANISGFTSEEAGLLTLFDSINVSGLILAGVVLGTAGALDDVCVTQASAVWALKAADPDQSRATLFKRAIEIGRDHIASTVNTLLLAYAGAALPLMVLFVLSNQSLGSIANSEVVAVEIIRTLIGSIGLVAAVPFTTYLAAIAADDSPSVHHHA